MPRCSPAARWRTSEWLRLPHRLVVPRPALPVEGRCGRTAFGSPGPSIRQAQCERFVSPSHTSPYAAVARPFWKPASRADSRRPAWVHPGRDHPGDGVAADGQRIGVPNAAEHGSSGPESGGAHSASVQCAWGGSRRGERAAGAEHRSGRKWPPQTICSAWVRLLSPIEPCVVLAIPAKHRGRDCCRSAVTPSSPIEIRSRAEIVLCSTSRGCRHRRTLGGSLRAFRP